jgi:PAS domain S-box-containing protein
VTPNAPTHFRAAFEQAIVGMVFADLDGRVLLANDAYLGIVGRSAEEVVGQTSREYTHPDDRDLNVEQIRRLNAGEIASTTWEKRYVRPDGAVVWALINLSPSRDGDGTITHLIGMVQDITDRRRTEEELSEARRKLDSALSAGEVATFEWDVSGDRLWGDQNFDRIFGVHLDPDGSAPLSRFMEAIHPDDRALVAANVQRTVDTGVDYETEYRIVAGDRTRWVIARGRLDRDEATGVTRFPGLLLDVTERKRAEETQRRLATQLRLALGAARMGWWQFDLSTGLATCDERVRELFGLPESELPYEDVIAPIHEEDRSRVDAAVRAAVDPGERRPYDVEYRVVQPDGSIRWIAARGQASFTDGSATTLVGIALDVTEVRTFAEVNRQLLESERVARAEAEAASRIKDEFLATLSHELRTPLSAILGWAQILGHGGNSAEEVAEGLAVIEQNARVQGQIIEDLLDMSRIVSGKVRLDVRPIDVAAVVMAAVETVLPAANAKGVRIEPSLVYGISATGDANRLQQVFWNLLANAVKFTPHGGRVEVRMEYGPSHVAVNVCDTGAGIPPEFLPYVFDRFRQADASTTRQHGGLGLGLAIVKSLTESHGGSVKVSSAGRGLGTTFTVTLPLLAAPSLDSVVERRRVERAAPVMEGACASLDGVRVLIVDDDAEARRLLSRFLEECNAHVATVSSASEALEAITSASYDVLVSDVGMPGEDGHALVRKVRTQGLDLPAVAVSAYARPEDRAMSLDAGFNVHLVKPVDPAALIAAVATVTARVE